MLQKNFPKNLQPRFCGDPRLKQPDSTLVERLGANVIQFKVPGQDENVLKSLRAQKSDIRITGIYDSHGSTQSTNDFLFQYIIHPSQGDICIYCQLDVDGEDREISEPDEPDDAVSDTNQIVPVRTGTERADVTAVEEESLEILLRQARERLVLYNDIHLYTLAEVLAKSGHNFMIPDPDGVLEEFFLYFSKVRIMHLHKVCMQQIC